MTNAAPSSSAMEADKLRRPPGRCAISRSRSPVRRGCEVAVPGRNDATGAALDMATCLQGGTSRGASGELEVDQGYGAEPEPPVISHFGRVYAQRTVVPRLMGLFYGTSVPAGPARARPVAAPNRASAPGSRTLTETVAIEPASSHLVTVAPSS